MTLTMLNGQDLTRYSNSDIKCERVFLQDIWQSATKTIDITIFAQSRLFIKLTL